MGTKKHISGRVRNSRARAIGFLCLQAASPQVEKTLEELKVAETKLSNRNNNLILIADSSDNDDNDKRIRQ